MNYSENNRIHTTSYQYNVSTNIVSSLPGGHGGITEASSNVSCKCECSDNGHELADCTVNVSIIVLLVKGGTGGCSQRWFSDKENEHVSDIQAAIVELKKLATSLEDSMKSKTYDSKEACESTTTATMTAYISGGLDNAVLNSQGRRDRPQLDPGGNLMDRCDHHSCAEAIRRGTAY